MHKAGPKVKEIIKEYIHALKKLKVNAERVILFGSYATENQKEYSDIDLIIVSKDFKHMNLRERLEVLGIAAARIMKPVEARGYTPDEVKASSQASFLREILEVGVSI